MRRFDLSFFDAMVKINEDLNLGLGKESTYKKCQVKAEEMEKESKQIFYSLKDWDEDSLAYWANYSISRSTLEYFNVFNVDKVWDTEKVMWVTTKAQPTFLFKFDEGFKLYSPFSKLKWYSKVSHKVLNGWDQLPTAGETLLITSSLKDVMVLYELGLTAIAPQGETVDIDYEIIKEIKDRFDDVYVFMDNDGAGLKANARLGKAIGCTSFTTPDYLLPNKDISDVSATWGLTLAKKVVNGILEEYQDLSEYAEIPFIDVMSDL